MTGETQTLRAAFISAYQAALRSVEPKRVTRRFFSDLGSPQKGWKAIDRGGGLRILALGKGAHGMAAGAVDHLGDRLVGGLIIADQHRPSPHPRLQVMVGDHPYPGRGSLAAGRAALQMVQGVGSSELLLVLVSGGGSSLMEVPAAGLSFDDLQQVSRALVTGGVPITEMNMVRRHLSAVKNGGISCAAGKRLVVTLLISDVVDGPSSAIASGPTLADDTTPADAVAVLSAYNLEHRVPKRVLDYLHEPHFSDPTPRHPYWVIADGSKAANAACRHLEGHGIRTRMAARPLVGDAAQAARWAVERAAPDRVDVYWGETTVRVETTSPGQGGRNQHAALVAARLLQESGSGVFGSFATDGVDGQSTAAGGLVDADTLSRGQTAGLDHTDHLTRFDSAAYLAACGDQVTTGPSGTNVGDLWMVSG